MKHLIFGAILLIALIIFPTCTNEFEGEARIIFESDRTGYKDIFSVLPNGSELTNLTETLNAREFEASWSPNGNNIAYVSDPMRSRNDTFGWDMQLIVMKSDGTNKQVVDKDAPIKRVQWAPSSNEILYFRGAPKQDLHIIRKEENGDWGAPQLLCPSNIYFTNIRTRFFFYGEDHIMFDGLNPLSIFRLNLKTCGIEEFEADHDNIQYEPAVTITGRIAFVRNQGGEQSLFIKDSFDVGTVKRLNGTEPFPHFPSWSLGGDMISFWSNSSSRGPGPIKTIEVSSGKIRTMESTIPVRAREDGSYSQRWEPRGRRMVFSGMGPGESDYVNDEIYVLHVAFDTIVNVSNNANSVDVNPRWQPKRPSQDIPIN